MPSMACLNFWRNGLAGMMAKAQPGRLKVLLGDISVIVRWAMAGSRVAMGTWILSASEQQAAMDLIGADGQVVPGADHGQAGEFIPVKDPPHGIMGVAEKEDGGEGVIRDSRRSKSRVQWPASRIRGTVVRRRPLSLGAERKGGYTGTVVRTPSPSAAAPRQTTFNAVTRPSRPQSHRGPPSSRTQSGAWTRLKSGSIHAVLRGNRTPRFDPMMEERQVLRGASGNPCRPAREG